MPQPAAQDIDMGEVLVGNSKDSVVVDFVQNTGTWEFRVDSIYFTGADANAFSLVSGFPKYIVAPNGFKYGEFRFTPNRVGLHTAEIVIVTQSETLTQKITGVGVEPTIAILGDLIDFGQVKVGSHKDTLQVVTIKNIGTAPLSITNTRHGLPNDVDFSTLAGGGAFTLQPNEEKQMDLRFSPSDVGRTSGVLEFYYNGAGSPAIVRLFGEGIKQNPKIQSSLSPFAELICDAETTSKIEITNTGGEDLIINKININGANSTEFIITETFPITIPPDSLYSIPIIFRPQTSGVRTAELEIKSNADPDSLFTIQISGRKDSVNLSPLTYTVDLGTLCINEKVDTVITIQNLGTIRSGGYIATSSNIAANNTEFVINSGETTSLPISFRGQNAEGVINESITIRDSLCGYTRNIQISGLVSEPKIAVEDIEITALIGQSKEGTLTIQNTSDRDFVIATAPVVSAPFSVVGGTFPLTIKANSSANIQIEYTPDDEITDNVSIIITGEPCNVSKQVNIVGIPTTASAELKTIEIKGYAGDEINIPVILSQEQNLSFASVSTIDVEMEFNPTLLYPKTLPIEIIDDNRAKVKIKELPVNKNIGEALIQIPFTAGLGNAEECDIILTNAKTNGGQAAINLINGKFTLLGVCREGGARLINPNTKAAIVSVSPNPTDGKVEIEISVIEAGKTELAIYNTLGEKVAIIYESESPQRGASTFTLNTNEIGAGQYLLRLTTPTFVESKILIIMK